MKHMNYYCFEKGEPIIVTAYKNDAITLKKNKK